MSIRISRTNEVEYFITRQRDGYVLKCQCIEPKGITYSKISTHKTYEQAINAKRRRERIHADVINKTIGS